MFTKIVFMHTNFSIIYYQQESAVINSKKVPFFVKFEKKTINIIKKEPKNLALL